MLLIKKIILVYFLLTLLGFVWIFWKLNYSPDIDLIILERATSQKSISDTRYENLMRWLAQNKLKYLGFRKKCFFNTSQEDINGSAINTLLAFYIENTYASQEAVTDLISDFSKLGCTINDQGIGGFSPLHQAILAGQPELVELLLELGADINIFVTRQSKTNGMNAVGLTKYIINLRKAEKGPNISIDKFFKILNILKK